MGTIELRFNGLHTGNQFAKLLFVDFFSNAFVHRLVEAYCKRRNLLRVNFHNLNIRIPLKLLDQRGWYHDANQVFKLQFLRSLERKKGKKTSAGWAKNEVWPRLLQKQRAIIEPIENEASADKFGL